MWQRCSRCPGAVETPLHNHPDCLHLNITKVRACNCSMKYSSLTPMAEQVKISCWHFCSTVLRKKNISYRWVSSILVTHSYVWGCLAVHFIPCHWIRSNLWVCMCVCINTAESSDNSKEKERICTQTSHTSVPLPKSSQDGKTSASRATFLNKVAEWA